MNKFKFDKGVEIPECKGKTAMYPLKFMEVGDSMFFEGKSTTYIAGMAYRHRPMKFTTRKVTEDGKEGCRCWRTE